MVESRIGVLHTSRGEERGVEGTDGARLGEFRTLAALREESHKNWRQRPMPLVRHDVRHCRGRVTYGWQWPAGNGAVWNSASSDFEIMYHAPILSKKYIIIYVLCTDNCIWVMLGPH